MLPPIGKVGGVCEPLTAADGSTYLLFLPPRWTAAPNSNPVLLFLHGIGGINNATGCNKPGLTTQFPLNDPAYAAELEHIVLVPVAAQRDWRNHFASCMALVDMAVATLGGDPNRIALSGQGMGGQGVFQYAAMAPERFCAFVAICGWVDEREGDHVPAPIVDALKSKPFWAFHSEEDDAAPDPLRKELGKTIEETEVMMKALQAAGSTTAKCTKYLAGDIPPNYIVGHAAFEMAFHSKELWPWLSAQTLAPKDHVVYCTTRAYNAPFPDTDGRPPVLSVLSLSADGTAISVVQETEYSVGTGCPMVLQLNSSRTKLFTVAGVHGVAVFDVDPADRGKVVGGKAPVCSPVTAENMPTPLGVFPAWVTIDNTNGEETVYSCNFFAQTVTALPFDKATNKCGAPVAECRPSHPGVPAKVTKNLDPNEEPGPFGAGFPENGCHPHGISIHPSGKWLVLGDLGSNNFTVYSLPCGESFTAGPPDFTLHAHTAPDSNKCYGAGPKNNCFSKDGKVFFSCNELDSSVSSYAFDAATGSLKAIGAPRMALPQAWLDSIPPRPMPFYAQCHSGGSLCLAPDGRHLYSTNRGHDSISCFAVGGDGALSPTSQFNVPAGGRISWNLSMPSDVLLIVLNQFADDPKARAADGTGDAKRIAPAPKGPGNLRVFRRDVTSGELTPTGCVYEVDEPLGILAADDVRWGA